MEVRFIFVFAILITVDESRSKQCNSTFKHEISVEKDGHNEKNCLESGSSPCQTLDYVLYGLINNSYLRNSTKIGIKSHQVLKENYNLTNLTDFALCGQVQEQKYSIKCAFGKGLIMESSEDIAIEHLTFRNCGSTQVSQDYLHVHFYTGIYMRNIVNVFVNDCVITNSSGKGMTFFDVGGHVMFNNTHFLENQGSVELNSTNAPSDIVGFGGGLLIEFTYSGGGAPFSSSNNMYYFNKCNFINNNSSTGNGSTLEDQLNPKQMDKNNSIIFGIGGGMGLLFKREAKDNKVVLKNCVFRNNSADWGGGYYFLFQDKSRNNYVQLKNVRVENNYAVFAGGGGRFGFFPQVRFDNLFKIPPNYFQHINCIFQNNLACWGGGISIFGTTMLLENSTNDTSLLFNGCHWLENEAVIGSAIGLLSGWLDPKIPKQEGPGIAYTIKLVNCILNNNVISNSRQRYGKNIIGTGALYTDIAPIIMQNVSLCSNNGTALVLDWSFVRINGNVTFCSNDGSKGGAIALYGRSKIVLTENSSLVFNSNRAFLQGGAIYARSQGPDLKAFSIRLLDRSTCFFSYSNPIEHPDNWKASVVFYNNTAPEKSGNSVYADTLQFCRNYGNFTEILEWQNTFHYENKSNPGIVTDPVTITSHKSSWKAYPGQMIHPEIQLKDEKNQATNGLLKLSIKPKQNSKLRLASYSSHYIYVSNGQSTTPITMESPKVNDSFGIILSSVYTQIISATVENISTLGLCYGGYSFDKKKQKCVCLEKVERPFGYSHCGNDGETIFMKPKFWGYIDDKYGKLFTLRCPSGYCKCKYKSDTGECVFVRFGLNTITNNSQCHDHRTGPLCGSCIDQYSVVVGSQECKQCSNRGGVWLILPAVGLTVAVLGIIYFELDFFSGPLNSWLYTYHIILLSPDFDIQLDPFIKFVIGLTHGIFDISTGVCFWDGMDELQKNTLQFFMPFYCIILLYFINKLLRYFPNLPFSNHSFHRALVTIVIITYASLLQNTMTILQPIEINGRWYVYIQAEVTYFGHYHLYFAIPALFVLLLIVIPFPFIIAFSSFFTRHFKCLQSFIPLFHVLQSPYRVKCSWFSSYYIFCRVIFILISMAHDVYPHAILAIWEFVCVLVLMIFVLLQPYHENNQFFFKIDTIFLSLLCFINSLRIAAQLTVDYHSDVVFLRCFIQILIYIPFLYSVGLLVLYFHKRYREIHHTELGD